MRGGFLLRIVTISFIFCALVTGCSLYRSTDRDDFDSNGKANAPKASSASFTIPSDISCRWATASEVGEAGLDPQQNESSNFKFLNSDVVQVSAMSVGFRSDTSLDIQGTHLFHLCDAQLNKNSQDNDIRAAEANVLQAARLAP
jgi:hypothetical protein